MISLIRPFALATAALLAAGLATARPQAAQFDSTRPAWRQLEFDARKLLVSASARVQVRLRPGEEIASGLLPTPAGVPVPVVPEILELIYTARGLGRDSLTTLWVDPSDGAALQRRQLDTGAGQRQRIYRFTDTGAYHYTRRPAGGNEKRLPPAKWTDLSEGMRAYPAGAADLRVTEPTALLWLVAAARLDRPGDQLEVFTFSRRHVHRVIAEVTGETTVRADFQETRADSTHQRRVEMRALVVRLRGSPMDTAGGDEPFELLGLRGDLELLMDPESRVPLQLKGQIRILGELVVRLRAVTMH